MNVRTHNELKTILGRITITGPLAEWRWLFHSMPIGDTGWLIWATFWRSDRDGGGMSTGRSRQEFISTGADESSVIKTAWVIVDLTMRHEAMESFRVDKVLIFDPHRTVDDLKGGR